MAQSSARVIATTRSSGRQLWYLAPTRSILGVARWPECALRWWCTLATPAQMHLSCFVKVWTSNLVSFRNVMCGMRSHLYSVAVQRTLSPRQAHWLLSERLRTLPQAQCMAVGKLARQAASRFDGRDRCPRRTRSWVHAATEAAITWSRASALHAVACMRSYMELAIRADTCRILRTKQLRASPDRLHAAAIRACSSCRLSL